MPDRSSRRDTNTLAFDIVQQATGQKPAEKEKDPAAVALGRKGGLKGGKARAEALSQAKRKAIAKKAAATRWAIRPSV
jgi:hypothetical protein